MLRSDRGGEYNSNKFKKFCEDVGLQRQLTVGYISKQNRVAERKYHTIFEMARSMLKDKGLSNFFWMKVVYMAVYLMNRYLTKVLQNKTPFEAWSGRKPSMKHFKVFGCICYAHIPKERKHKLDEVSKKYIFVGYSSKSKGYKLFSSKHNKMIIKRDILFNENAT